MKCRFVPYMLLNMSLFKVSLSSDSILKQIAQERNLRDSLESMTTIGVCKLKDSRIYS